MWAKSLQEVGCLLHKGVWGYRDAEKKAEKKNAKPAEEDRDELDCLDMEGDNELDNL